MTDFAAAFIAKLLPKEGGYSNDPNDAGGETNWGIDFATARENGYDGAMSDMTQAQAVVIYTAKYFVRAGVGLIAAINPAVAEEVFDTGVNMGTGSAAMMFQRALNVLNRGAKDYADIAVDGGIGSISAAAFTAYMNRNVQTGESVMLKALNCLQGAKYIALCESTPADETVVNGWLANRIGLS